MIQLSYLIPCAYLAGSVNFAILVLKAMKFRDPREVFSGNAGTSNVYRLAGVRWAALVLILDVGRAAGVALAAIWLLPPEHVAWCGFGLVMGNRYPVFHGFRGGKGVAAYLGFTAILSPLAAGFSCLAWVSLYFATRIVFIASFLLVAVLGAGILVDFSAHPSTWIAVIHAVVLIVLAHRPNIRKLAQERRQKPV